jgi:hypothetical protein
MKTAKETFETYSITPVDKDIDLVANSVSILNQFKELGYTTRGGFVDVVQENIEGFAGYRKVTRLFDFWQGRVKNEDLNKQLTALLNTLKSK